MIENATNSRAALTKAALNPARSVVVEACAGSGKTWLLVSRMLRLLLAGAAPSSILAITFTRKAAEEMKARLMQWLEFLATATDAETRQFLRERALSDTEIDALLPKARQLFTEVAFATPHLGISTFHGWFQQLLSAAPLGMSASDATIAESESSLLEEAWLTLATSLNRDTTSPAAEALNRLFAEWGLHSTRAVLWNFVKRRAEWRAYAKTTLHINAENDADAQLIDAALNRWRDEWRVEIDAEPILDWAANHALEASIRAIVRVIGATPGMTEAALNWPPILAAALTINNAKEKFAAIRAAFLTLKDEPRVNQSRWAEKAGAQDYFQMVCASIQAVLDALTNQEIYAYNRDALIAGTALLEAYEKLKTDQHAIDFADLEWRAFSLLTQSEHAETMQYRLDQRYRHILLDEFQDTNPIQWQCLTAWLSASVGADNRPTVFMVGDPKQAIYRFRRTDARLFQIAKQYFAEHFGASIFALNRTRRNAPAVVDFVNSVFVYEPLFAGFAAHETENAGLDGAVAVLPKFVSIKPSLLLSETELRNSLTTPLADDDEDRYAQEADALATAIAGAIGHVKIKESRDGNTIERGARYSDFMILFRRRAPLAAFERALRDAEIPYVGARPGGLMAALEVRDMVALLTFLSSPNDDLALAQVLKSPLFNVDDTLLLRIRFCEIDGVINHTWWQRLQSMTAVDVKPIVEKLSAWLHAMDSLPVHDLLDRIFHEADVLNAYARVVPAMMRASVLANLNAFMALALEVDSGRYPSLTRFLNELKRYHALPDNEAPDAGAVLDDATDESETTSSVNAVRLMTIHAAKGLESPIVWLIDADDVSTRADAHTVLSDWQPDDEAPQHFSFWATKALAGKDREPILAEEARVQAREQLNLLYVAATRAKQYLVLSGTERRASKDALSWHDRALKINSAAHESWPFVIDENSLPNSDNVRVTNAVAGVVHASVWPLPTGSRTPLATPDFKRESGIAIHAALEQMASAQVVSMPNTKRTKLFSDDIINMAEKILATPALARFFNVQHFIAAHNEIEIATQRNGEFVMQRIDRLVEFEHEVWVLDYKTGNANIALHREQITAYCDAVAPLYKNKTVRGAVIDLIGELHIIC